MKKLLSTYLSFFLFVNIASSQNVVATSGGYFENGNISMSFTIGEPVIETFTGSNFTLTQGFQQPFSFFLFQTLNIPAGWSGISSYLDPANKSVSGIFSDNLQQLILLASMDGFYYPQQGINTIGNWNYSTGYQIKAEDNFELTIQGSKLSGTSLELPAGWSLIPVLSFCDVNVEALFAEVNSLKMIKEVAGTKLYWPQFGINTLQDIIPGRAYFVAVDDVTSIAFPECSKTKSANNSAQINSSVSPWNELRYSATSHIIAITTDLIKRSGILPGDIIGAFTPDGFCAGFVSVNDLISNISIAAFAKDELTANSYGFGEGEVFRFRVYRSDVSKEFDLMVDFDPTMPNTAFFTTNGLSALSELKVQPVDSQQLTNFEAHIYPNPSNGKFGLTMSYWPQKTNIIIRDFRGSTLEKFVVDNAAGYSTYQFDLSRLPKGVYFLSISGGGLSEVKRFVVF